MNAGFKDPNSAILAFKTSSQPDTFQWNVIIKSHIDSALFDAALSLFCDMRAAGARPDHYTFPLINRAISSLPNHFSLGESIHCRGIQLGFDMDVYFCNTMIDVYVRYSRVSSARHMFDEMRSRDVVSWTSVISGYIRILDISESFILFHKMQMAGFQPNSVTLAVILRACCIRRDASGGRQFHGFVIKRGFENDELVKNSIMTMFSKAGCFEDVEKFFSRIEKRSAVSWNILMSAYSSMGDVSRVVECFEKMKIEAIPSHETLTLVISAFAKCGYLLLGQKVHGYAVKRGVMDVVLQASLVDFYAKCCELALSFQLFEEVEAKNSITWSVMMWGFIQNGQYKEAINLFQKMQMEGLEPNADIIRGLVLSYTHLGALQLGKGTHGYLIKNLFHADGDHKSLETSILNMYTKCGSIALARSCFDRMVVKDIVAWSSMIEGYAIHGFGSEALRLFYKMQEEGVEPNSITILSVLSACSHSGLVTEGCEVFDSLTRKFGIKPELNHYTSLVDLLGRSGKLHEAVGVIINMTHEPDGRIWGALLASCRIYSDGKLGRYAAQRLFNLEPENVGYHVVLSNIHTSGDRWDEAENIRKSMEEKDFKKKPGWSCIELRGRIHMFVAGDSSHPQVGHIYGTLGCLTRQTEETGCY